MAAHVPAQPAVVSATANKAFVSALGLDRSFSKELVEKYGNELYTFVLDMLGKKTKTENETFYHYEGRRRMAAAQVASITGGGSAGVDCVATISAGSHYDSGKKSPGRIGEVVMISASGILGKITAIGGADSAHTYTIKPLKATDTFAPGANDWLLFQGAQHVGEGSSKITSMQRIVDKISNTVTEIREDYRITDKAAMEKIEWSLNGQQYYKYVGTQDAEKRFLNNRELLTVFSDVVTNTGITSNGTSGTKGMITQIASGGSDFSYAAGSAAITDFQKIGRELTFNGANSEIHFLQDIYQNQELMRLLFATYPNGAIQWGSVGGSGEVAAKYGFTSLTIDGFTYHFKKYAPFSPEWLYGVAPAATPNYRNYGVAIPQGFANTPMGKKVPTIALRYMEFAGKEINAWDTGGLAESNKTDVMELNNHFVGYYGVEVGAANQCVIFQA